MTLVYIGQASVRDYIPGIPTRDLTDAEVAQFGGQDVLIATGLYALPPGVDSMPEAPVPTRTPRAKRPRQSVRQKPGPTRNKIAPGSKQNKEK